MLMGKAPFEDKDRAIVRNRIVNVSFILLRVIIFS